MSFMDIIWGIVTIAFLIELVIICNILRKRFFSKKEGKKPKNRIFGKEFFKTKAFYIKDLIRDINRIGKKREERVNVLYMDNIGNIHLTIGYLSFENIEFYIGGLKISKGLDETVMHDKCFIGDKLHNYYFIPATSYKNLNFSALLDDTFKLDIADIDRDRTRIIECDITKTAIEMNSTQSSILRTFTIVAFLGGLFFGAVTTLFVLIIF